MLLVSYTKISMNEGFEVVQTKEQREYNDELRNGRNSPQRSFLSKIKK